MHFFPSTSVIDDWMVWLALAVLFMIIEVSTVNLISIWFAIGSLAALGLSLMGPGLPWQIATFIVFSVISLILFLYFRKKLNITTGTIEKTNADRNIGRTGKVIIRIDDLSSTGQVKVSGQTWSASSSDGSVIEADELVEVVEIKGVRLIVKRKVSGEG